MQVGTWLEVSLSQWRHPYGGHLWNGRIVTVPVLVAGDSRPSPPTLSVSLTVEGQDLWFWWPRPEPWRASQQPYLLIGNHVHIDPIN